MKLADVPARDAIGSLRYSSILPSAESVMSAEIGNSSGMTKLNPGVKGV
jgi:hypothetical protein